MGHRQSMATGAKIPPFCAPKPVHDGDEEVQHAQLHAHEPVALGVSSDLGGLHDSQHEGDDTEEVVVQRHGLEGRRGRQADGRG
eukprot:1107645-Pelagomonas_calceolata.AAC.4